MRVNLLKKYLVYGTAWFFIAAICYFMFATVLYVGSIAALLSGIVLNVPILFDYQKDYYFDGGRAIFQYDPSCVQSDKNLIYKPKLGGCRFDNPEFRSHLNFNSDGRSVPARNSLRTLHSKGVAVVGDSYAMGWGVNDEETFANILQEQINRPIYNLGVSSYGTERELKSLVGSGLLDKVDTVVIQYCDNDLGENFKNPSEMYSAAVVNDYAQVLEASNIKQHFYSGIYSAMKKNIARAVKTPFKVFQALDQSDEAIDFTPHWESIKIVLRRYQGHLKNKKIIFFYLNEGNRKFVNYPPDSKEFGDVFFMTPNLNREDFFPIDGHLNALGNKSVGLQLANFLRALPTK